MYSVLHPLASSGVSNTTKAWATPSVTSWIKSKTQATNLWERYLSDPNKTQDDFLFETELNPSTGIYGFTNLSV